MSFPHLSEHQRLDFPDPRSADREGLVAWGGNLSPGMVLSAYESGIFPWYSEEYPILWYSPDPRCIVPLDGYRLSKRIRRYFHRAPWTITVNRHFELVLDYCKKVPRMGQDGTWITDELFRSFIDLHRRGYAQSVEVWEDGRIVAGLYGLTLERSFSGESMFTLVDNGSKAALMALVTVLARGGWQFIDAQVPSPHMMAAGGREIDRSQFLELVSNQRALPRSTRPFRLPGNRDQIRVSELLEVLKLQAFQ